MRTEKEKAVLASIGNTIRQQREQLGMPRTKLATELGVEEKQLRLIENGEINTSVLMLLKICFVLELDLNFLKDLNLNSDFIQY